MKGFRKRTIKRMMFARMVNFVMGRDSHAYLSALVIALGPPIPECLGCGKPRERIFDPPIDLDSYFCETCCPVCAR